MLFRHETSFTRILTYMMVRYNVDCLLDVIYQNKQEVNYLFDDRSMAAKRLVKLL